MEDVDPVDPTVTKTQVAKRQATRPAVFNYLPLAAKTQPKAMRNGSTAIIVHGVPCKSPMADIIQYAEYTFEEVVGARWLLQGEEEGGKDNHFCGHLYLQDI